MNWGFEVISFSRPVGFSLHNGNVPWMLQIGTLRGHFSDDLAAVCCNTSLVLLQPLEAGIVNNIIIIIIPHHLRRRRRLDVDCYKHT
jgi:hypothetical protein